MKGKVLIIGSGAREGAIELSLLRGGFTESVFIAPGNGNPDSLICQPPPATTMDYLALALKIGADLTIVGPEKSLTEGVVDLFTDHGLAIIGPNMEAAQLEGSKIFAKRAMKRWGVPTAYFQAFVSAATALDFLSRQSKDKPHVVKADGLAGGKGVIVAANRTEAIEAVKSIAAKYGERMVIEEKLVGRECTFTIFVRKDGNAIVLPSSADHKRLKVGDQGSMTGGMGCYAPHPAVTDELERTIIEKIVCRTLEGLAKEKIRYSGFLYFGLMLTAEGPKVLEYNVRLGDPEASVIMPLVRDVFWDRMMMYGWAGLDIMTLVCHYGKEDGDSWMVHESAAFQVPAKFAVSVVLASEHYPSSKHEPKPIFGIKEAEEAGIIVLHAGTKMVDNLLMTSGGRVLNVVGTGANYTEARAQAYAGVSKIHFDGMQYRTDIAEGL